MPHSHHSHSGEFCKHAVGSLEDVVQEAIRQGFEIYGLTEHVPRYRTEDLYPEEDEAGLSLDTLAVQFEKFLVEAHRLKALYASHITLLVGLETEYIVESDLDRLNDLLKQHGSKIEYMVGSVHHVNGIPIDFDKPTFQRAIQSVDVGSAAQSQDAFLSSYLDAQFCLLKKFHPEVIGHLDLCRLYNPDLKIVEYPDAWKKMERNILYAIGYGALFEVNAAAFRKGWETAYPGKDLIEVILKHGGRFALSDDSHGPQAVGLNYHRVLKYLQDVGVKQLWYLQKSSIFNAAGRQVIPCQVEGNWDGHPFWIGRYSSNKDRS